MGRADNRRFRYSGVRDERAFDLCCSYSVTRYVSQLRDNCFRRLWWKLTSIQGAADVPASAILQ